MGLTEASLARVQASLQQAGGLGQQAEAHGTNYTAPLASDTAPNSDRIVRERDEARAAAAGTEGQIAPLRDEVQASRRMHRESQAELIRLRVTHGAPTADLIQTVKDRDSATADTDCYREDASDLREFACLLFYWIRFLPTHSLCFCLVSC